MGSGAEFFDEFKVDEQVEPVELELQATALDSDGEVLERGAAFQPLAGGGGHDLVLSAQDIHGTADGASDGGLVVGF